MAILPAEQHKQVALVVIVAAIGLMYLFHQYWYSPRSQEIERLQSRATQLEDQNRRAQIVAARGGEEMEERLAAYERHVQRLEELIPAGEEVPALLRSIALEAQRVRVVMDGVRPEPSQAGEFYTRESYEMSVIGEYHDVGRFLTAIASLPRIITPVDLELGMATGAQVREDLEDPIRARFRVMTYVLPGDVVPDELPPLPGEDGP
jgi:type IV pilus assembly protein PilO